MELKVMTFNLRVHVPQDGINAWSHRSAKVAEVFRKYQPEIAGTQEGLLFMLKDIENSSSDYSWVGEGRRGGEKDEYCAIFYNHHVLELVKKGQFWLSETPEVPNSISWNSDYPRICTWAAFQYKKQPDKKFIVYNTHLDHISQDARENGMYLIWETIQKHQSEMNLPFILMGDLNSTPDNNVIRFLRGFEKINGVETDLQDVYTNLTEPVGSTFHAFEGITEGDPIDYIFLSRDITNVKTIVDKNKIDGGYPSDHYPVIANLKI